MSEPEIPIDSCVAWTAEALERLSGFKALLLGGSRGRGDNDAFSDYDLVAVFEPGGVAPSVDAFLRIASDDPRVAYAKRLPNANVANLIFTDEWTRVDVSFAPPAGIAHLSPSETRVLIDPDNLAATISRKPVFQPSAREIEELTLEFVRIYSLLPVVIGREELEVGFSGAALLQLSLIRLLSLPGFARAGLTTRPGALAARRYLRPDALSALAALPPLTQSKDSIIAFHAAALDIFERFGRQVATDADAHWPKDFLAAAKDHIAGRLG